MKFKNTPLHLPSLRVYYRQLAAGNLQSPKFLPLFVYPIVISAVKSPFSVELFTAACFLFL